MTCHVLIVGAPSAAGCASDKTWRAAAALAEGRLVVRFGAAVAVEYVDLFTAEMLAHPDIEAAVAAGASVPLVFIDGEIAFWGGKLNVSALERAVAGALEAAGPSRMETSRS